MTTLKADNGVTITCTVEEDATITLHMTYGMQTMTLHTTSSDALAIGELLRRQASKAMEQRR